MFGQAVRGPLAPALLAWSLLAGAVSCGSAFESAATTAGAGGATTTGAAGGGSSVTSNGGAGGDGTVTSNGGAGGDGTITSNGGAGGDGTVTSNGGAGGSGSTATASGGAGGALLGCAHVPDALVCEDFDDVSQLDDLQGWLPGGQPLALVNDAKSPPNALRASVANADGSAFLSRSYTIPANVQGVRLRIALRVLAPGTANTVAHLASIAMTGDPSQTTYALALAAGKLAVVMSKPPPANSTITVPAKDAFPIGAWHAASIVLEGDEVSCWTDGVKVAALGAQQAITVASQSVTLRVGIPMASKPGASFTVVTDDVALLPMK
jgi:hypothetical protein